MNLPKIPSKYRRIIQAKFFSSAFAVILLFGISVLIILIAIMHNSETRAIKNSMESEANEISTALNNIFVTTESDAVLLGSLASINDLLSYKVPDLDHYINARNDISSGSDDMNYASVELFINSSEKIYASRFGLIDYEDYLNPEIMEIVKDGEIDRDFIADSYVDRNFTEGYPKDTVTYMRRLPLSDSRSNGYLAIHILKSSLLNTIKANMNDKSSQVAVFFNNEFLCSTDSEFVFDTDIETSIYSYLNVKNMSYVMSDNVDNVSCVYFTDNNLLFQEMFPIFHIVFFGLIFIFILATVLSYFYSYHMLKPIESFMDKIGLTDNFSPEKLLSDEIYDKISDEFMLLKNIDKKCDPLDRERQVLELITSYSEITSDKLDLYKNKDIIFDKDSYAVIIMTISNDYQQTEASDFDKIKIISRKNAENRFSELGNIYGCYNESNVVLFLLNYKCDPKIAQRINKICEDIKINIANNLNTKALFTFGFCKKGSSIPYQAYLQARKNMFVLMESRTTFDLYGSVYEYIPAVDKKSAYNIAQAISSQNTQELNTHFNLLIDRYILPNSSVDDARKVTNTSICRVYTRLIETGFTPDDTELISTLSKLKDATSVSRCKAIAINYFSGMIESETKVSDNSYTYVRGAIEYIESNYQKTLTIPEIADSVSINSVYLSRIFKNATGKTMNEYLNQHRITQAKKALKETNLSVQDISINVGYADVRSFIRFFKKYTNLTPLEFRKSDNE